MAGIDPYSPCPCGSGEKFKWCCQKVEAFTEKAGRLYEGGQVEAALDVMAEGLRKNPNNPLLAIRKAVIEYQENNSKAAETTLRAFLGAHPENLTARVLLARIVLESEGPSSASAHLQNALSLAKDNDRRRLANLARMIGVQFSQQGKGAAALRHFQVGDEIEGFEDSDSEVTNELSNSILGSATFPDHFKTRYSLSTTPANLPPELAKRFDEALSWSELGLWNSAAAEFESLSAAGAGPYADRNLGLLRMWTGDSTGAALAFRRASSKLGSTTEAVDLEVLHQLLGGSSGNDTVDRVQLIWPLKNRDLLLEKLRAAKDVVEIGVDSLDPNDEKSPEVTQFALLDRPALPDSDGSSLKASDMPRHVCMAFVGKEIAGIVAIDDNMLPALTDRFTSLAVPAVPPAHPKTKVLGQATVNQVALSWDWEYPASISPAHSKRLQIEEHDRVLLQIWPKTKQHFLGGRSPLDAAKAGDAEIPLRAALLLLESSRPTGSDPSIYTQLRTKLNLQPEPELDPDALDSPEIQCGRLGLIPLDRLTDDQLARLYEMAGDYANQPLRFELARRLADRSDIRAAHELSPLIVFGDLAMQEAMNGRKEEALAFIAKGRAQPDAGEGPVAGAAWDFAAIRILAATEKPEVWVAELAVVLERYGNQPDVAQIVMLNLASMGLLQIREHPENPGQMLIDSRMLQSLMAEYGPKITTASGRLGVSAARPEVWTPESEARGSTTPGGIWTPGSPAPGSGGGEKSKLIIPGR